MMRSERTGRRAAVHARGDRWTLVGAVVTVVLMSLSTVADAKVIGPPFTKAAVTLGGSVDTSGCHSSKATHKLSFNRTSGVFAWANSATSAICPSTSGTTSNLTGAYSYVGLSRFGYLSMPIKVPKGASSLLVNWSWMATYRLAYTTNGSAPCASRNYTKAIFNLSGAYGNCYAEASIQMTSSATLFDMTNGSVLYATGGPPYPYYPYYSPYASASEAIYNDTTVGYYVYNGTITSENSSAGPSWNVSSGVVSGPAYAFFNYSMWASDKYILLIDVQFLLGVYVAGFSKATASGSLDAFTAGQGLKVASVTVV